LYHEYFDDLREEARYQEMVFKVKNIPDLFDFSQGRCECMQRRLLSSRRRPRGSSSWRRGGRAGSTLLRL
jgi:hypothetical protein